MALHAFGLPKRNAFGLREAAKELAAPDAANAVKFTRRWRPEHLGNHAQLALCILASQERHLAKELGEDAAK